MLIFIDFSYSVCVCVCVYGLVGFNGHRDGSIR